MADRLSAQFSHDGDTFGVFETEVGNRLRRYQGGVPIEVDPERFGWALLDHLAGIYRRAREQSRRPGTPPFLVADLLVAEPPSIAADLKTPPAGAVEGAEITRHEWSDDYPRKCLRCGSLPADRPGYKATCPGRALLTAEEIQVAIGTAILPIVRPLLDAVLRIVTALERGRAS